MKRKEKEKQGSPAWMVIYTDMMTLLLVFFVILLSMAIFDKIKIEKAAGSIKASLGVLRQGSKVKIKKETIISEDEIVEEIQSTEKRISGLINYIESVELKNFISIVKTDRGISVRILDSVLFRSGYAELMNSAVPILEKIASVGKNSPYDILVEGHTDDVPIHLARFPSNWELSTSRAVSVVKFMIRVGVKPEKLSAVGYSKYHPIVPNITPGNRAVNRRVEINFIDPMFSLSGKNIFK